MTFDSVSPYFVRLDHQREARCGFPEVIFAPGKSVDELQQIGADQLRQGQPLLVTRLEAEVFQQWQRAGLPTGACYYPRARVLRAGVVGRRLAGVLRVICAGTADLAVAEEALECARSMGCRSELIADVGVAGLHRLLAQQHKLRTADVLIVVAGMEGALPSVVGGLVACPLIAVPTSIGYGSGAGGLAALLSMLNSCAAGIAVVNIDNGFGAAAFAARVLARLDPERRDPAQYDLSQCEDPFSSES